MAWTQRYMDSAAAGGGDGTTSATSGANGAWTLAETIAGYAAGHLVNMKQGTGGNYASATTSRAFATSGSTTAPVWFRGYKTTPGDLDAAPLTSRLAGTDLPSLSFTTGGFSATGTHLIFSNLDIVGARTAGQQASFTGANILVHRCRVEDTAANAASSAVQTASAGMQLFTGCWFKATSSATRVFDASRRSTMYGCTFEGGIAGYELSSTLSESWLYWCNFLGQSSHGIKATSANAYLYVDHCGFSVGGDGVRFDAAPTSMAVVGNCTFRSCGGNGISNVTGTTNAIRRLNNSFWVTTAGPENGMGDSPRFDDVAESADPWTSATNPTLVTGALSKAAGFPGLFENSSFRSYPDIGAVQGQASGGAALFFPLGGGILS